MGTRAPTVERNPKKECVPGARAHREGNRVTQLEALILRFLDAFSALGSLFRGHLVAQQTSFHTNRGEEGLPRSDCHLSGGVLPASHRP